MTLTVETVVQMCRRGLHPLAPGNLTSRGQCAECGESSRLGRVDARVARMVQLLVGFKFQPRPGWGKRGACRGENYELFELVEATKSTPSDVVGQINAGRHAQAREFCKACPVVAECLGEALSNRLLGTWGGELLTAEDWSAAYKARKRIKEEAA